MNPVVVHVVRPYASELEYLAAEAWSIDGRSMVLIDAEELPADTAVLFDVALADGQKPIRAEGRVVGMVAPKGDRPGGLKVRFKRFGAATKAFIERAVKARDQAASSPAASAPQAAPEPSRPSMTELERPSVPEVERPSMPEVRASMTELEKIDVPPPPAPSTRESSGVRARVPGPVAAPANREELLEKLRQRRRAG